MITVTAAVVTLGCRLNQADSALLSDRLMKAGFKIVEENDEDSPNLIVVNSCTVTATAARKTRQALASLRRKHPYAYIILTGCAAEADPDEAADTSDYDILMTNADKTNLETILERRFNISPEKGIHNQLSKDGKVFTEGAVSVFPFKTRANLKIQEITDPAQWKDFTSVGRIIFNQALPKGWEFINKTIIFKCFMI